jgi:hypothetical protein
MDDSTLWREATKYLWGLLVPAAAWIFNKQDKRISMLEENHYSKGSAKERREEVDKHLEARRQDVIALHTKIDDRAERLDDKIDKMNSSMHDGFSEIKTLLIERMR